jgi:hypothetical protein
MSRMGLFVGVRELNCNQRVVCDSLKKQTAPIRSRGCLRIACAQSDGSSVPPILSAHAIKFNTFEVRYV